jgi:soluble lytic murein transglycosylase-like protein
VKASPDPPRPDSGSFWTTRFKTRRARTESAPIQTESEFDPLAVSSRGACGLMQLMPVTARRFGVSDCFDPRQNILAGTRFLKSLLTRYRGSVALSIAAYNAGESAVARHRGIPPYAQTRAYVRRVQALLRTS